MAEKPPPKPAAPNLPKPKGLIEQTGNRPGGTVTQSYKYDFYDKLAHMERPDGTVTQSDKPVDESTVEKGK